MVRTRRVRVPGGWTSSLSDREPARQGRQPTTSWGRRAGDLRTPLLRALVPAALAIGIIALYPPISDAVVERLGTGFRPQLVSIYVATLVGLFLLDAFARDRRVRKTRERAARAELRAERQHQRAEELRFVLDVAGELNGRDRIESSLFRVLARLHEEIPFTHGHVFLRSPSNTLERRGIWPLTSSPTDRSEKLAEQTVDIETYDNDNPVAVYGPVDRPDAVACAIRFQEAVIGVLVLEGIPALREHDQPRLLALADRLGASLNGVRVLSEVESRERLLRHAYQELRHSGRRLARSAAITQASLVGRAAREAIAEPLRTAALELARLKRSVPPEHRTAAFKRGLEVMEASLHRLDDCSDELRALSEEVGDPDDLLVNEALVAAIDLVAPELKRSQIDLRLSLDRDPPPGPHGRGDPGPLPDPDAAPRPLVAAELVRAPDRSRSRPVRTAVGPSW